MDDSEFAGRLGPERTGIGNDRRRRDPDRAFRLAERAVFMAVTLMGLLHMLPNYSQPPSWRALGCALAGELALLHLSRRAR